MRRIFQNLIKNKRLEGQKGFAALACSIDGVLWKLKHFLFLNGGLWKDVIVFTYNVLFQVNYKNLEKLYFINIPLSFDLRFLPF